METIFIHRFSDGTLPLRTIMLVCLCLYFFMQYIHELLTFSVFNMPLAVFTHLKIRQHAFQSRIVTVVPVLAH